MRDGSQHAAAGTVETGKQYVCALNGTPLYEAMVKNVMGCWATVKVVQPLPGPYEEEYKTGQAFDIRINSYTFLEK